MIMDKEFYEFIKKIFIRNCGEMIAYQYDPFFQVIYNAEGLLLFHYDKRFNGELLVTKSIWDFLKKSFDLSNSDIRIFIEDIMTSQLNKELLKSLEARHWTSNQRYWDIFIKRNSASISQESWFFVTT